MTSLTGGQEGVRIAAPSPALARTWLLVPGTRSDLPRDGMPDALVWDLEDGVAPRDKATARALVAEQLDARPAWVRIGDAASASWTEDLDALGGHPGLLGVVLAKAEGAIDVERTAARVPVSTPVVPMIESARALELVAEIARHPSTLRLAFGIGDFRLDTGIGDDPVALAYPRSRMVVASAAAGIAAPIDGPSRVPAGELRAAVRHGRTLGLTGKLVLDAAQVSAVERELTPAPDEVRAALELLGAPEPHGFDGSYAPRLARARRTVALAAAYGLIG